MSYQPGECGFSNPVFSNKSNSIIPAYSEKNIIKNNFWTIRFADARELDQLVGCHENPIETFLKSAFPYNLSFGFLRYEKTQNSDLQKSTNSSHLLQREEILLHQKFLSFGRYRQFFCQDSVVILTAVVSMVFSSSTAL